MLHVISDWQIYGFFASIKFTKKWHIGLKEMELTEKKYLPWKKIARNWNNNNAIVNGKFAELCKKLWSGVVLQHVRLELSLYHLLATSFASDLVVTDTVSFGFGSWPRLSACTLICKQNKSWIVVQIMNFLNKQVYLQSSGLGLQLLLCLVLFLCFLVIVLLQPSQCTWWRYSCCCRATLWSNPRSQPSSLQ